MRFPFSISLACAAFALPAAASDNLFVGTADGSILKGDPVLGGFELDAFPATTVRAVAQLGNRMVAALETGFVYAYSIDTGLTIDIFHVDVDPTDMVVHDGTLLISDVDGSILRVNPVSGEVIETFETGFEIQALAVDGDNLFAGTPFGVFHQKDLSNDSPFGFAGTCGGPINSIISRDNELFLGDTTGNVYIFDKTTQFVSYAYTITNDATSIVADGDHFLIGGSDGSILRVLPPHGEVTEAFNVPSGVNDLFMVEPEGVLLANAFDASVSVGATVQLDLHVHTGVPGSTYWVLGSLTGKGPLAFGDVLLPLTPDLYTAITMQPEGPLTGSLGTLDAEGNASVSLNIPSGSNPGLAGLTVYHASVIADLSNPNLIVDATNAVALQLLP